MPFNKSNYFDRFEKLKLQIGKDFDQLNFIHPSVEKVATQPEGSPTDGLRYIVGEASDGYGEGAFSECPKNYIAEYDSRLKSWTFFKPYVGMEVIDKTARYLKKYTGTQWTNYMSFSVSESAEEADIAQYANTAGALANSITFSLSGAVVGVTNPAVNLSSSVTIPTTLSLTSNSSISGILPIGKGGTGNNNGKVPGLNHKVVIRLSGGVISDPSAVTGSDFSIINFGGNEDDLSTYPHTKTLYDINVTNIDASCIQMNELSVEHGGTGNTIGKAASAVKLYESKNISLSNMGSGSTSFDGSQNVTIPLKLTLPSDGTYNTSNITGILPIKNGGTGNITGKAASAEKLDHSLMIKITGAVTGEWDISEPLEGEIGTSKNLASNATDNSPNQYPYALYRIKTTKLNISNPDYLIGPLPPSKGGTGRVDGTVSYADSAGSANSANSASSSTNLSKYFKLSLEDQNSNNFGNSSAFNGNDIKTTNPQGTINLPIKVTTIPSSVISGAYPNANVGGFIELKQSPIYLKNGSETIGTSDHKIGEGYSSININLDTSKKFPKNMHYDPTEAVSPTYTRVAVDSKGHIIRGSSTSYLKKTTFKNLPYIYDISPGNTFICVIKKDDTVNDGTVDFGSNAGYISYYTRPFTFFNDSNIYISNSDNANIMTISVNVNFNGLRLISTDASPSKLYRHYFDILLTNTDLSNCIGADNISSSNYLNIIKNNNSTAYTSTFLNGCYHLFGSSNSTFENCGLNIYNRNLSILKYEGSYPPSYGMGDPGTVSFASLYYTSIFNFSKNITNSDNVLNKINFKNPVYGIIKLSMPTDHATNTFNISFNSQRSEPLSNYGNYGHTLRLVTPRIDFEYNSY